MSKRQGMTTLSDVKDRCVIDEAGCWIWKGATWNGTARAYYKPLGGNLTMPGVLYHMRFGKRIPHGVVYYPTCGNALCMRHREVGTRRDLNLACPVKNMTAMRAAVAVAKRRQSRYSAETIAELLRQTDEPLIEKTKRLGMNHKSALNILNGKGWAGAPGSSVFAWRP